jgi:hypothetical protein
MGAEVFHALARVLKQKGHSTAERSSLSHAGVEPADATDGFPALILHLGFAGR